jgi:hypothetical protein
MSANDTHEKIVIELSGTRAGRGIGMYDLENFIDHFLRSLRAFDRSRRLEPGLKSGHPTKRDELVTALRIVELKPGSAVLRVEPSSESVEDVGDDELFPGAPTLAIDNLEALGDAIGAEGAFDPDVADEVGKARRALGVDGLIRIRTRRSREPFVIDETTERRVAERARRQSPRSLRIVGRLHAIDLEPERVGIRDTDGTEWTCHYAPELEPQVKALLDANVWARGFGQRTGALRATVDLEEIHPVGAFEQAQLFTFERVPLEDLLVEQGIGGPRRPSRLRFLTSSAMSSSTATSPTSSASNGGQSPGDPLIRHELPRPRPSVAATPVHRGRLAGRRRQPYQRQCPRDQRRHDCRGARRRDQERMG